MEVSMAGFDSLQQPPNPTVPRWTMLSVRLDPRLVRDLKVHSVLARRSMRAITAEALRQWIDRNGRQL
jgi:hypothetical protein